MLTGVVTAIPYAPATGVTSRFTAVADAYVSRTKEHRNFGSCPTLRTTARPRLERSYLRFAVTGLSGEVTAPRPRLYAATASRAGYAVRAIAAGGWAEGTITYVTAPAPGGIVATSGPVASDTWTSVDITGLVRGDGLLDVVLTTDSRSALYASRETGATAPQLVVETAGTTASSQTTTTTTTMSSTTTTLGRRRPRPARPRRARRPAPPARRHLPGRPATEPRSARSRHLGLEPPHPRQRPAGRQLGRHGPPPLQRRPLQRDQWRLGVDGGTGVLRGCQHAPVHLGRALRRDQRQQVPIPPGSHEAQGPGANTDHKYIVIDTDAKLVYDIRGADVEGRDCLK